MVAPGARVLTRILSELARQHRAETNHRFRGDIMHHGKSAVERHVRPEISTMLPCFRRCITDTTARLVNHNPLTLTTMTRSHSRSSISCQRLGYWHAHENRRIVNQAVDLTEFVQRYFCHLQAACRICPSTCTLKALPPLCAIALATHSAAAPLI